MVSWKILDRIALVEVEMHRSLRDVRRGGIGCYLGSIKRGRSVANARPGSISYDAFFPVYRHAKELPMHRKYGQAMSENTRAKREPLADQGSDLVNGRQVHANHLLKANKGEAPIANDACSNDDTW